MEPITTIPTGLLGLLEMQQTGRNPRVLADFVQGSIDFRDHYLAGRRRFIVAQASVNAAGNAVMTLAGGTDPCVVPPGKIWIVTSLGFKISLVNTEAFAGNAFWWLGPAGSAAEFPLFPRIAAGPVTSSQVWLTPGAPTQGGYHVVPPGASFSYNCEQVTTAAAVELFLYMGVSELSP